jgi:hypothetical protein
MEDTTKRPTSASETAFRKEDIESNAGGCICVEGHEECGMEMPPPKKILSASSVGCKTKRVRGMDVDFGDDECDENSSGCVRQKSEVDMNLERVRKGRLRGDNSRSIPPMNDYINGSSESIPVIFRCSEIGIACMDTETERCMDFEENNFDTSSVTGDGLQDVDSDSTFSNKRHEDMFPIRSLTHFSPPSSQYPRQTFAKSVGEKRIADLYLLDEDE